MAKAKQDIAPSPLRQTIKWKVGYGDEDDRIFEARRKMWDLSVDDM